MYNHYVLHNRLGEGGYSTVHKCTDNIGIRYVCKILPKNKNTRDRVHKEIEIMKQLNESPKIVRYHDAGENDDAYYIIQEWCRGGNVKDYITEFNSYAENTIASIVRGVLRGLIHMHDKNIIHCDIKSSNILLGDKTEDADVKIADLGTAMHIDEDILHVDSLVGTPWFLAPENLSHIYTKTSDVWSLGVMTYQLLTGRMPFNDFEHPTNPRVPTIWKSILMDKPQMEGKRWIHVSQDAKDFIQLCLIKDHRNRPSPRQCLEHVWLTKSDCNDRFKGKPLNCQPFIYENDGLMNACTLNIR